jgi:hypothetical protein
MTLEDDIDVTPHFHDLNNHHYFLISSRCRLLVFWIDQRSNGRFLKTLHTAVDAWDGDYDPNQQWTRWIRNTLGSYAISDCESRSSRKYLAVLPVRCRIIIASDRNNATNLDAV